MVRPPHERTLSTAIVGAANYGMMVITFAAGPLLVPAGADDATLKTWDLRCDPEDVRRREAVVGSALTRVAPRAA